MAFPGFGKIVLMAGLAIALVGLLLLLAEKGYLPWLGRLPGDFYFKGRNISFFFPLMTSLLISIILSCILWLINRK